MVNCAGSRSRPLSRFITTSISSPIWTTLSQMEKPKSCLLMREGVGGPPGASGGMSARRTAAYGDLCHRMVRFPASFISFEDLGCPIGQFKVPANLLR